MKKKFYGALLLGSVLLAGGMVSCSDYDDDINSLTQRVDAIEKSVADLKAAIENGKTIKSVTSIENGFEIEFSDGQKYAIKNGENGANGDTWTIGSDGYWYKMVIKQNGKLWEQMELKVQRVLQVLLEKMDNIMCPMQKPDVLTYTKMAKKQNQQI